MVYRVFCEKKERFAAEAAAVTADLKTVPGAAGLERVRLFNRYDAEGVDAALLDRCRKQVFSEPQTDEVFDALPDGGAARFAVEYLPGQFDMRASAAEDCIRLIAPGAEPTVRTARVYILYGSLTADTAAAVMRHLINPVECRPAAMDKPVTLAADYPEPPDVPELAGFLTADDAALAAVSAEYGLAMDMADLAFLQAFFRSERRCPTETELKVLDTYWSDHCRHTTFGTELESVTADDPATAAAYARYRAVRAELGTGKPETLMDMATVGTKYLKKTGRLTDLDESPEINACTVKTTVTVDGRAEPWLLLFKNETHNHPTEIEPFGGAATCLGGAIRDPLSGRGYVYQAMRVTGAADPRRPASATIPGRLSQRKITTSAAAGYSSYGNQIGLATGLVHEFYHNGYAAKRMEIGAVIGAAPESAVRREEPAPGDAVLLIGGRTGRDGCGGATGASKAHTLASLDTCGAEVQKGNAPEERKLQRLFRDPAASRLIKRCNDFGAGGVCVAIGELADGLKIDLDAVPLKYAGLNGTEIAISESQERMAVVVAAADAAAFTALAAGENLTAVRVASVTEEKRLVMTWRGKTVLDLPRAFIDSNGAARKTAVKIAKGARYAPPAPRSFAAGMEALAGDISFASQRGLTELFDSTVGARTALMPMGGRRQLTPAQAMAAKFPVAKGETDDCSVMAFGFDPYISAASPYIGAYSAVTEAVCRATAAGAPLDSLHMSFQEYFPRPNRDPLRWGLPAAALLGGLMAQLDLGVAAIGGKDSMSGSFEALDVPPTLVAFACGVTKTPRLVSPEFKRPAARVTLLEPERDENGLPVPASMRRVTAEVEALIASGLAASVYVPGRGGLAEAVMKARLGNGLGFAFDPSLTLEQIFAPRCGAFLIELTPGAPDCGRLIGVTAGDGRVAFGGESVSADALERIYDAALAGVFPAAAEADGDCRAVNYAAASTLRGAHVAAPRALIPVFPGTNCEYESALAVEKAGGRADIMVINTLNAAAIADAVTEFAKRLRNSELLFIPGGFSGGDEPDGSARLITAFLRNAEAADALTDLLDARGGLILGVCNGFQALIKLGLVPYGRITDPAADTPTLTANVIGRHQSRIAYTRVASVKSPWLRLAEQGGVYAAPVSHGEGRLVCPPELLARLAANGQIATQYCDADGRVSMDIAVNPNGSALAAEGLTSPDGRVFGKMAHAERIGEGLYKNVPGRYDMKLFASAVEYFK